MFGPIHASSGKGSLFDSVEDMDTGACLEKLLAINAENQ